MGKESACVRTDDACPTTRLQTPSASLPKIPCTTDFRRIAALADERKKPETPKADAAAFRNSHFFLLLGMDDLFHPAHHAAKRRDHRLLRQYADDWPVEKAAEYCWSSWSRCERRMLGDGLALIADGGGEFTVSGNGIGGRNSAFVLTCVEKIAAGKFQYSVRGRRNRRNSQGGQWRR